MSTSAGVHVVVSGAVSGNLIPMERLNDGNFSDEDARVPVTPAQISAIPIAIARLNSLSQSFAPVEDRMRIVPDLHDCVISRHFGIGMNLHARSQVIGKPGPHDQVS